MIIHIVHPAGESPENFLLFLEELRVNEPLWNVRNMGSLRTRPGSIHADINSADKRERGTLELTYDPKLNGAVELKVASNRASEWCKQALERVKGWLEEDLS